MHGNKALLAVMLALAGCGKSNTTGYVVTPGEQGYAYGYVGDLMRTAFFDYRINDIARKEAYGDLKCTADTELLVVNLSVRNTTDADITMYDTDFQCQWGDADSDYTFPVTYTLQEQSGNMLKGEYVLASGQQKDGDLVYQIPAGTESIAIAYQEQMQDGTTGNSFFVYNTLTN